MAPRILPRGSRRHRQRSLTAVEKIARFLYFCPMIMLLAERLCITLEYGNLAAYLNVETMATSREIKEQIIRRAELIPSIEELTRSRKTWKSPCSSSMEGVTNVQLDSKVEGKIPKIIHQTARSRCVTSSFAGITKRWKLPGYSYYFHDDEAKNRLLGLEFPEFPHLKLVLRNCLKNATVKADLWKYLLLWAYGGVYADIETVPAKFDENTLRPEDDGFFLVDQNKYLGQWFMAVSPRHPLIFYAIHWTLENLMKGEDTTKLGAHIESGPHALHSAYLAFRRDMSELVDPIDKGVKPVWSGTFNGTNNRTITVVGRGEYENEYVQRMAVNAITKARDYQRMGMTHFSKLSAEVSSQTCHDAILSEIMEAVQ